MSTIYTKNGEPLRVSGDAVFGSSGQIGRIKGKKVFGPDGRYVGTLVGDRLVYRSTDSASLGPAFAPRAGHGSSNAPRAASAMWGDEPDVS